MLKVHAAMHKATVNITKIKPVRIVAKRKKEVMVIIKSTELGYEDAEWVHEDNVDVSSNLLQECNNDINVTMPIFTTNEHLQSPWEDDYCEFTH